MSKQSKCTREKSPGADSDDEDSALAIHNRPTRVRRAAQDYLVENAALYDLTRLYAPKKRRRDDDERIEAVKPGIALAGAVEDAPRNSHKSNGATADVTGGDCGSTPAVGGATTTSELQTPPSEHCTRKERYTPPPPKAVAPCPPTCSATQSTNVTNSTPKKEVRGAEGTHSARLESHLMTPNQKGLSTPTPRRPVPTPPPPSRQTPRKASPPPPLPIDDDTMLQLMLVTLSGRQASVHILAGRSVGTLAARVEALLGIPREQVRFKHNGVDIPLAAVNQSLNSVGVRSGDALLIRLEEAATRVGPPASPFKDRVSLFAQGAPKSVLPPSPYKDIPSWMRD